MSRGPGAAEVEDISLLGFGYFPIYCELPFVQLKDPRLEKIADTVLSPSSPTKSPLEQGALTIYVQQLDKHCSFPSHNPSAFL